MVVYASQLVWRLLMSWGSFTSVFSRATFLLTGLLIVGLAAVGCGSSGGEDQSGVKALTIGVVKVGVTSAPLFLAQEKGYFAAEGVKVTFKEFAFGAAATQDLLAGGVDLATTGEYVVAANSFARPDIRVVCELGTATDVQKFVVRTDRGIASPSDLRGKKVGTVKGSAGEYYLATLLGVNGLAPAQIDEVFLTPTELVEAIVGGELDAVQFWEPYATQILERLGDKGVSWDGQAGQRFYWVLLGTDQSTRANAAAVESLLAALIRAETYALEKPSDAQAVAAAATGQSLETVTASWAHFTIGTLLSEGLRAALSGEIDWLSSNPDTSAPGTVVARDLFYLAGLEAAAPDAITLIR
jgi:ABC-type nitrate/sulfonate/bicarbonate transport system substrate-binding protein